MATKKARSVVHLRFIWAIIVNRKCKNAKKKKLQSFLLELLSNAAWTINDDEAVCVLRQIFGTGFVFWDALFPREPGARVSRSEAPRPGQQRLSGTDRCGNSHVSVCFGSLSLCFQAPNRPELT